jgi:hypothetical protein
MESNDLEIFHNNKSDIIEAGKNITFYLASKVTKKPAKITAKIIKWIRTDFPASPVPASNVEVEGADKFTALFNTPGRSIIQFKHSRTNQTGKLYITILDKNNYSDYRCAKSRIEDRMIAIFDQFRLFYRIISQKEKKDVFDISLPSISPEGLPKVDTPSSVEHIRMCLRWKMNLAHAIEPARDAQITPIAASYLAANELIPRELLVHLCEENNSYWVVDWSAPSNPDITKSYKNSENGNSKNFSTPLEAVNFWLASANYPQGSISFSFEDPSTGKTESGEHRTKKGETGKLFFDQMDAWHKCVNTLSKSLTTSSKSLQSMTWTPLHGYASSVISTGSPNPPSGSNSATTEQSEAPSNQALVIAEKLFAPILAKEKWVKGAEILGYLPNESIAGRFYGVVNNLAVGVICEETLFEKIKKTITEPESVYSGFLEGLEIVTAKINNQELITVDILPSRSYHNELKRIQDTSEQLVLNDRPKIIANTKSRTLKTRIDTYVAPSGEGFEKLWLGQDVSEGLVNVNLKHFEYEETFAEFWLPKDVDAKSKFETSKPQFKGEPIPSDYWIYVFQASESGKPELISERLGGDSTFEVDSRFDVYAFSSKIQLPENIVSSYIGSIHNLEDRSCCKPAGQFKDGDTIWLIDYYQRPKDLAENYKLLQHKLMEAGNSERAKLCQMTAELMSIYPSTQHNLATGFKPLFEYGLELDKEVDKWSKLLETHLDALYKIKNTTQWIMVCNELEIVLGEDVRYEYWASVTHSEEHEYFVSCSAQKVKYDPRGIGYTAYRALSWAKIVSKVAKSSKLWEWARLQTIIRSFEGLSDLMSTGLPVDRKKLKTCLWGLDFKKFAPVFAKNIDKMQQVLGKTSLLSTSQATKFVAMVSEDFTNTRKPKITVSIDLFDNVVKKGPVINAYASGVSSTIINLTAEEHYHSTYRRLQFRELAVGHVAAGMEAANLILLLQYYEQKRINGGLSQKDNIAILDASLGFAKEMGTLATSIIKHRPELSPIDVGESKLKSVKKNLAVFGVISAGVSAYKSYLHLQDAKTKSDKSIYTFELGLSAATLGIAVLDAGIEFSFLSSSSGVLPYVCGPLGVVTMAGLGFGYAVYKYDNEDSLRNWAKRTYSEISELPIDWKVGSTESPELQKKLIDASEHLLVLAFPALMSASYEGIYSDVFRFQVKTNGAIPNEGQGLLSDFSFKNNESKLLFANLLGLREDFFSSNDQMVILNFCFLANGMLDFRYEASNSPISRATSWGVEFTFRVDLDGKRTSIFPKSGTKISLEWSRGGLQA